jgi:hypothetical protein
VIGASAILDELLFVGLPLLVLIAAVALFWRSKGVGMSLRAKLAIGVFLSLFPVASFRSVHQFREHRRLGTLRVDEVAVIDIDGKRYSGKESLSGVIQALNQSEWFTSSHGGWAREVPVTVRLRSNEQLQYRVALYLREPGAVIILFSRRSNGG